MIKKVCVIGSGVMGSGIAAQVANAGFKTLLMDVVSTSKERNLVLNQALSRLIDQKPPPLSHPTKIKFIEIGNLEDNLEEIRGCDFIIEVIVEKLEIKHELYQKISPYIHDNAVLASNTSTLPLSELKKNLSSSLKKRFLITHFFNPPRFMELVEIVTDNENDDFHVQEVTEFIIRKLGKTIVNCNDTPGFIANRVGCFLLELTTREAIIRNLKPEIIDKIFTNILKLPSTGIFGLYDLIGFDVMKLISSFLLISLAKDDFYHKIYQAAPLIDELIEKGNIGRKKDAGFYKLSTIEGKKIKEIIDFNDGIYKEIIPLKLEFNTIEELFQSNSQYAIFIKEILAKFYLYLFKLVPSVTDNFNNIDTAIKLGYNWKYGPIELLCNYIPDGLSWIHSIADSEGIIFPQNLEYKLNNEANINKGKIILKNNSAELLNYNNHLVFKIKTKMNCLNFEVFELLINSVEYAEGLYKNLYIFSNNQNFSAGADLTFVAKCLENKDFRLLEDFIRLGQKAMMRLKYSKINIISCACGVALGGGCEILLHSDYIFAHQELNAGLVEVNVGLIPAFGGTKEMFLRSNEDILLKNLRNIINQNKTSSADYFKFDYEFNNIIIVMNKSNLLDEAIKLELPEKKLSSPLTLQFSKINLQEKFSHENITDLQKEVIDAFQKIIDLEELEETDILELEVKYFMKLANKTETLSKLKKIIG